MRYKKVLGSGLCAGAVLALCAMPRVNAVAGASSGDVSRFGICASNFSTIVVTQEVDENTWHLEITLNSIGTKDFRHMRGEIVDVSWDGVSLGKVRFTSVLNRADLSDAKYIQLQSRGWSSFRTAMAQIKLIGNKSLDAPCGLIR